MQIILVYLLHNRQFTLNISILKTGKVFASILKTEIEPFGLAMSPNISFIIINNHKQFLHLSPLSLPTPVSVMLPHYISDTAKGRR